MNFITNLLAMIVVINPLSKMIITGNMTDTIKNKNLIRKIINNSNLIALLVIGLFAILGPFIFKSLFNISDYALLIACGISLSIFGIDYLFKDDALSVSNKKKSVMYLSIGTPLIAGPASITTITIISSYSSILTSLLVTFLAVLINYIVMMVTYDYFNKKDKKKSDSKFNYLNVKWTGLLMLALGVQFIINGINLWISLI